MNRLKQLRKNKKMSQLELATQLGIPRTTYTHYESGKTEMDYALLCKTADIFCVSIDELLGRDMGDSIFDNALIERPELFDIYAKMTESEKENLLHYAKGIIAGRRNKL